MAAMSDLYELSTERLSKEEDTHPTTHNTGLWQSEFTIRTIIKAILLCFTWAVMYLDR